MENAHLFSLVVKAVERELGVVEMLDASPQHLRKLQAERIVRAAFSVLSENTKDAR